MFTEGFIPFYPIDLFDVSISIPKMEGSNWIEEIEKKKLYLPDLSPWLAEKEKFLISAAWGDEGLFFFVESQTLLTSPLLPDFTKGDSLELFIDTRAVKEGRFIHRFCHHFFFLPHAVEGKQYGEVTRFRGEERRAFAKEEDIEMHVRHRKGKTAFFLFLSKEALFGYDPDQCKKIGFAARLNRHHQDPLHFHLKTDEFKIEEEPTLWAPLTLI